MSKLRRAPYAALAAVILLAGIASPAMASNGAWQTGGINDVQFSQTKQFGFIGLNAPTNALIAGYETKARMHSALYGHGGSYIGGGSGAIKIDVCSCGSCGIGSSNNNWNGASDNTVVQALNGRIKASPTGTDRRYRWAGAKQFTAALLGSTAWPIGGDARTRIQT